MENKLKEVVTKIAEVETSLRRAKDHIIAMGTEANVSEVLNILYRSSEVVDDIACYIEDAEMEDVDFSGINLDEAFEGNPVSAYVNALADYSLGDVEATKRMMDAFDRIAVTDKLTRVEDLLNVITERENSHAKQVEVHLREIEHVLKDTSIDNWTHAQTELARYFLQFQPDASVNEVEALTPYGVQLAWKPRRYLGATK